MLLNTRFGDYVLVRKIATGGMAEVHLAIKRGPGPFDRLVALKTILRHHAENPTIVQMFYNEARLGARFNHSNLINVFDVEVVDDTLTMVMEYVPGQTVADVVKRVNDSGADLRRPVGIRVVLDACLGLHDAHHLKDIDGSPLSVVHRDVSPQNILVGYDGQVKVFDFGIAHTTGANGEQENLAGVLAGKYAYMSPEQCHGGEVDERSDVFSLGIILYELTTRKRLFRRKNQIEVLRAITEEPILRPTEVVPDYPRGLERVVMSALEREAQSRPATALELHDALLKYAALADEQMSSTALSQFMAQIFEEEIAAEQNLIRRTVEEIEREDEELAQAGDEQEADESEEPSESVAEQPDMELDLERLAARSVTDARASAFTADEGEELALDAAFSGQLRRARRLNLTLAVALLLVLAGAGAASAVLLNGRGAEDASARTGTNEARLIVQSVPSGATIFLDGVQLAEVTPAAIDIPLDVPVQVRTELEAYRASSAVVTATRDAPIHTLHTTLGRAVPEEGEGGAVRVVTLPADSIVIIDEIVRGTATPLVVQGLELGVEHLLRAEREGYEPRVMSFELLSRATREIRLELQRAVDLGMLSVFTDPDGAQVLVDGEPAGQTPLQQLPLVSGREFQVGIELEGYRGVQTTVRLEPNEESVIQERLVRPRRTGRPADGLGAPEEHNGAATEPTSPAGEEEEEESPYEILR